MTSRTFSCIFLLLMTLCSPLRAQEQAQHNFEVSKNLEIFNSIYKLLDLYYVDTLRAEKEIPDAVNYLLDGLDPYTEYFPENATEQLETMTTGKYAGIGALIHYYKPKDRCVISEPYEHMPAAKAGLRAGDVILRIDGEDVGTKGARATGDYTSSISGKLRGDPNTELTIVVERPGQQGELTFTVQRAAVKLSAVPYYGMVTDSIGYVCLSTFTANCSQAVREAVADLRKQGAQALVLDLRNNGGGLANEAVDVVNIFVPQNKLILQMKGKTRAANSSYTTRFAPLDTKIPLVVLVNGGSASSSEITCGALQDLDRAVIMGERTFGKGLVQQPRPLPYGGVLKLTTSRYYIPSGRCIQALDYSHRGQNGEAYRTPDSLTHVFYTLAGRPVRDGGGITPDVESKSDSLPHLLAYLRTSDPFFDYCNLYRANHSEVAPAEDFDLSDADYEEFKQFMAQSDFTYDRQTQRALEQLKQLARFEGYDRSAADEIAALEKKLQPNLDTDLTLWAREVKNLLNTELCTRYYYQSGAVHNSLRNDKALHDAIRLLRNPKDYQAILAPKK